MNGIVVYHHNDLDGRSAGNEVYTYLKEQKHIEPIPSMFIEKDYNDPFSEKDYTNKSVYIVDLSFTKKNISTLFDICEQAGEVTWIDHHKTSIEAIADDDIHEKLNSYSNLKYFVNTNLCATVLAYLYFKGYFEDDAYENDNAVSTELMIHYNRDKQLIIDGYITAQVPLFKFYVLVDWYDRWIYGDWKEPQLFNSGVQAHNNHIFAYLTERDSQMTYNTRFWDGIRSSYFVDKIINDGKIVENYKTQSYAFQRKINMYESIIDGHKALVINGFGNSQLFGEDIDKYDVVCAWEYNGKKKVYTYSLYSTKDNIDCSKIAQKYNPNGGGHKGASGFSSKELIFK